MGGFKHDGSDGAPHPLVHGAHVILVNWSTAPGVDEYHQNICILDFSRRGWYTLSLHDEGYGVERRVSFEDGRNLSLEGSEYMDEWEFQSLGDGRFTYLVSHFPC